MDGAVHIALAVQADAGRGLRVQVLDGEANGALDRHFVRVVRCHLERQHGLGDTENTAYAEIGQGNAHTSTANAEAGTVDGDVVDDALDAAHIFWQGDGPSFHLEAIRGDLHLGQFHLRGGQFEVELVDEPAEFALIIETGGERSAFVILGQVKVECTGNVEPDAVVLFDELALHAGEGDLVAQFHVGQGEDCALAEDDAVAGDGDVGQVNDAAATTETVRHGPLAGGREQAIVVDLHILHVQGTAGYLQLQPVHAAGEVTVAVQEDVVGIDAGNVVGDVDEHLAVGAEHESAKGEGKGPLQVGQFQVGTENDVGQGDVAAGEVEAIRGDDQAVEGRRASAPLAG